MRKLLIAEFSDTLRIQLQEALQNEYAVTTCADGAAAVRLLDELRPDALIMDLMLPELDGLAVLAESSWLPPAVLCISSCPGDYVLQRATDLGVGYVLMKPCSIRTISGHLALLLSIHDHPLPSVRDAQAKAARHLLALGIDLASDGGNQLRIGIPLFAQDPSQRLGKELYPAIIARCGSCPQDMEYTMRDAIKKAWSCRDKTVWDYYFPGSLRYPSNKHFIARLAQILSEEA